MRGNRRFKAGAWLLAATFLVAACAPAAQPTPTTAPAQPAAQQPGTQPTAAPAAKPTDRPAGTPAGQTAAQPTEKPVASADRQEIADFYRDKTVRIIVGFSPGGGFDTYARTIGRHLGKHIPGNPTVIVENMPGAGSMQAANYLYNVAPKDGTELASFHGNLFMQELFGAEGIEFEGENFEFVAVPTRDRNLCIASAESGFTSLEEAQNPGGRELILGGTAPGSTTDDVPTILREALDLNLRLVEGYGGTSKIRLAMQNGEVHGMCGWSWESIKTSNYEDVASGEMVPLVQVTDRPIPDLPVEDVPLARDLATTEEGRRLILFGIENPSSFNRPHLLPPGTPKERVEAMRQAYMDTLQDPELLAEAERIRLNIDPVPGDELERLVRETLSMPEEVRSRLQELLIR